MSRDENGEERGGKREPGNLPSDTVVEVGRKMQ